MLAKVKDNARFFRYVFFSGNEYIKGEYREVPKEFEEQARVNELLDLKDDKSVAPQIPVDYDPDPMPETEHKRRGRKPKNFEQDLTEESEE